ncbi:MAG: type II toxin-antitoxin system VapC family toxin [Candidatus Atribacteria bacterium]|nr:type II toxin-antitoxin system VapC family toxin [Candidatus Atribacteria bacterium]
MWYFTGSKKLGQKALEVFRNSLSGKSIIFIPTIVLAEIIDIIEKKRISVNYEELLDEIEKGSNFEIYPLDVNVLKTLKEIKGISELHDKIIVATAKLLEAKVITKDADIQSSNMVKTIW